MPLWYRRLRRQPIENIDLVAEFLETWLVTRMAETIDPGELAGVIDVLYEMAPSGTMWAIIEIRPHELARYITTYVRDGEEVGTMMSTEDNTLRDTYASWIRKGHETPPIIIAGVVDEDDGGKGIMLIDGRHRIHAAVAAGKETILAYIPVEHLPMMKEAIVP
jgi:uncharacterized ParB-like nuclease family protein